MQPMRREEFCNNIDFDAMADANDLAESFGVPEEDLNVKVKEEGLMAEKKVKEAGEVRIHKNVKTEEQTLTVPVTTEEVIIERVPVSSSPCAETDATSAPQEDEIRIPVYREELEVKKRLVVTEEVRVRKQAVMKNESVSDTVKREEIQI